MSYIILQMILLIVVTRIPSSGSGNSIASAASSFVCSVSVLGLSYLEHSRSTRPSTILITYLSSSSVIDIGQLFHQRDVTVSDSLFHASVVLKLSFLLLEAQGKKKYLRPKYQSSPQESLAGTINQSFLWWLNGIFFRGPRSVKLFLEQYQLDPHLSTDICGKRLKQEWGKGST